MFRLFLVSTLLFSILAFSSEVISITEIVKDKDLCSLLEKEDWRAFKDKIVKIPKGTKIPIRFVLEGDFFSLPRTEVQAVTINKTLFVTMIDGKEAPQFLFSVDGKTWKAPEEFFTGVFSSGFGLDNSHLFLHAKGKFFERK